jgi:PBP1b-binding outer membrane lipoprotein LpoB
MEESMKKVLLITLLAMLLISTLVTGCKKKAEEPQEEVAPIEETTPAPDTTVAPTEGQTPTTTPTGK